MMAQAIPKGTRLELQIYHAHTYGTNMLTCCGFFTT